MGSFIVIGYELKGGEMSLNLSKLTLIVFVILLTSCTSSLKFDSKYCSSDGKWTNQFDHSAKYISVKKVGFGKLHLNLNQVLQRILTGEK